MYRAETTEQYKIMRWLTERGSDTTLVQAEAINRNTVMITRRDGTRAMLTYKRNGRIESHELEALD